MTFSQESFEVFERSIADYHKKDNVDTPIANPYKEKSIEFYLYLKNWIDTVQWAPHRPFQPGAHRPG